MKPLLFAEDVFDHLKSMDVQWFLALGPQELERNLLAHQAFRLESKKATELVNHLMDRGYVPSNLILSELLCLWRASAMVTYESETEDPKKTLFKLDRSRLISFGIDELNTGIRFYAFYLLYDLIGEKPWPLETFPGLRNLLVTTDDNDFGRIDSFIRVISRFGEVVIPQLKDILEAEVYPPNPNIGVYVIRILAKINYSPEALRTLLQLQNHRDINVRLAAHQVLYSFALSFTRPEIRAVINEYVDSFADPQKQVRLRHEFAGIYKAAHTEANVAKGIVQLGDGVLSQGLPKRPKQGSAFRESQRRFAVC